jgi:hypothetical protein
VLPITKRSNPFAHVDLFGFVTLDKGVLEQFPGIRSIRAAPYQTGLVSDVYDADPPFVHKVCKALGPDTADIWIVDHCWNRSGDDIRQ